jgi:hypothetical protein
VTVGAPIAPDVLPADPVEAAARLMGDVEDVLPADPDRAFA